MNPNNRKPPGGSGTRRDPQPEYVEETLEDWFDPEAYEAPRSARGASSDDEPIGVAEEVCDFEEDGEPFDAPPNTRKQRSGYRVAEKGILESIGDGLRSAGQTAQRYTTIGVTRAGLEKLRFELRSAHAQLGELVIRCWADAPDLGLTSNDPAIIEAVKRVKLLRRAMREKQAKIAELRKKDSVV
ncbi:MAG: hypothetical protein WCT04_27065 [Planctomycetota bacterium]